MVTVGRRWGQPRASIRDQTGPGQRAGEEERGRDHALVVWRAEGKGPGSRARGDQRSGGAGQDAGVQELGIHAVVPRSVLGTH